jgi:hypothetical protein
MPVALPSETTIRSTRFFRTSCPPLFSSAVTKASASFWKLPPQ